MHIDGIFMVLRNWVLTRKDIDIPKPRHSLTIEKKMTVVQKDVVVIGWY